MSKLRMLLAIPVLSLSLYGLVQAGPGPLPKKPNHPTTKPTTKPTTPPTTKPAHPTTKPTTKPTKPTTKPHHKRVVDSNG